MPPLSIESRLKAMLVESPTANNMSVMSSFFHASTRSSYRSLATPIIRRLRQTQYFPLLTLFDRHWYASRYPDVIGFRGGAFAHYVRFGAAEGRDPSPYFSTRYYVRQGSGVSPGGAVQHYLKKGWRMGLNPHPLFDTKWYLSKNPDVKKAGINPLLHWILFGIREGRMPSPAIDGPWYLSLYPDVAAAGANAGDHFLRYGGSELRNPNAYFDAGWYVDTYRDAEDLGQDPLSHFVEFGAAEERDPGPKFSTRKYLDQHPALRTEKANALVHYLTQGRQNGLQSFPSDRGLTVPRRYFSLGELSAGAVSGLQEPELLSVRQNFLFRPLNVEVDPTLSADPRVLILLPGLNRRHATGGPNTAYILGALLAEAGVPLSFVSVDAPPDTDIGPLKSHIRQLTGVDCDKYGVQFLDASNRQRPFKLGYNDILFATAWWTAQPAKAAAAMLRNRRIYYLIQDFESKFYGGNDTHSVAQQTYSFDHLPVINTTFLRDQLATERIGRYADQAFAASAIVFEPAVDRSYFYPQQRAANAPHRLLFYARPTMAERNLFGLGLAALRAAASNGIFDEGAWEFIAMGEDIQPVALGGKHMLKPAPWLDFPKYAELMRTSDMLLSLMFSPHPSYPPLEMAACGKPVITTCYGVKTRERLAQVSPYIVGVEPTIDEIAYGISRALLRRDRPIPGLTDHLQAFPTSWKSSLSLILPQLLGELKKDGITPRTEPPLPRSVKQLHRRILPGEVELAIERRKAFYRDAADDDLIAYLGAGKSRVELKAFERSLLAQDSKHAPEWIVKTADSRALGDISHGIVHVQHVDSALRDTLERSRKQYVVWVQSACELLPDATRIIEAALEQSGLPEILIVTGKPYDNRGTLHGLSDPIVVIDRRALLSSGIDLDSFDPELAVKRILGDPAKAPRLDEHLVLFRSENK